MKLQDLLKSLDCEMFEVTIPVKGGSASEKRWFCDAADLLLQEEGIPEDAEVEDVFIHSTVSVTCFPCAFTAEEDADTKFDVQFSSEEMRMIDEICDGWFMSPPEVVQKIVKHYLKNIEEE